MADAAADADADTVRSEGFVVLPNVLSHGQVEAMREALAPHPQGRPSFMGYVDGLHPRRLVDPDCATKR